MRTRLITLSIIVFSIALFRLLPHPPNVSPVAAMALFGGVYFADRRLAFLLPFAALLLSDLLIGLHDSMPFVYAGFALTVLIGFYIRSKLSATRIVAATVFSSALFFALTNFGVWLTSGIYPATASGLMQAWVAGVPFLQNSLLGNLAFTALMFGGFALLQQRYRVLRQSTATFS
jgi:Family of unknown function (DUF6580)